MTYSSHGAATRQWLLGQDVQPGGWVHIRESRVCVCVSFDEEVEDSKLSEGDVTLLAALAKCCHDAFKLMEGGRCFICLAYHIHCTEMTIVRQHMLKPNTHYQKILLFLWYLLAWLLAAGSPASWSGWS